MTQNQSSKRARLTLRFADRPSRAVLLPDQWSVSIGRSDECDCMIDHGSVSRQHAQLRQTADRWIVSDNGSKNGTFLMGQPVEEPMEVADGDWIRFGDIYCEFQFITDEMATAEDAATRQRLINSQEMSRALTPSLGVRGIVDQTLGSIIELSGYERGFVLLGSETGEWRIFAQHAIDLKKLQGSSEFSGSLGAVERCLEERSPVICHSINPGHWLADRPSIISAGIEAVVCLPLQVDSTLLGVVYVDKMRATVALSELDLHILESLTTHAALALAMSKMEAAMSDLSNRVSGDWAKAGVDGGEGVTVAFSDLIGNRD